MSRVLVACATCSKPFEPINRGGRTTARYCSNPCREHARAIGRAKGVEKALLGSLPPETTSPEAWGGKTKYSSTPPLVEVFRVYCVMCGDEEYLRKTQAEVRRIRQIPPCPRCQGARWIEPDGGTRVPSGIGTQRNPMGPDRFGVKEIL